MGIMTGIKAVMGFTGVSDTVNGIVKKIAGTDILPSDAMDLLIKYQEATKHQSIPRRFIAVVITLAWAMLAFFWLLFKVIGRLCFALVYDSNGDEVLNRVVLLSNEISQFMIDIVNTPFAIVIAFYFTMKIVNGVKR